MIDLQRISPVHGALTIAARGPADLIRIGGGIMLSAGIPDLDLRSEMRVSEELIRSAVSTDAVVAAALAHLLEQLEDAIDELVMAGSGCA